MMVMLMDHRGEMVLGFGALVAIYRRVCSRIYHPCFWAP